MKNLFDGISKVQIQELIFQIANLECYRISIYFTLLLRNFFTISNKYFNKILFTLNIKKDYNPEKYVTESIDNYYYKICKNLESCTKEEMNKRLRHQIKIRVAFFNNIFNKVSSDDFLSVCVTKVAAKILNKEEKKGKSISEKNDLVFQKYPNINKPSNKKYLKIWLVSFAVIFLMFFIAIIFTKIPFTICFIIMGISQVGILCIMSFFQTKWQMAHFVWLSVSGGDVLIDMNKMPINLLEEDKRDSLKKNMQAIHALLHSVELINNDINNLEHEIKKMEFQHNNNSLIIEELQENDNGKPEEALRIINDKSRENEEIVLKIKKNDDIIKEKNKIKYNLGKTLNPLIRKNIVIFKDLWNKYFPNIYITDNIIQVIISQFLFDDLKIVEKRFYEIHNSSEPGTIAEKKGNLYTISFLTVQGDSANIDFSIEKDDKRIIICSLEREGSLNEAFIINEELKDILEANNINKKSDKEIEELMNWYKQQKNNWEIEEKKLKQEVSKLKIDKSDLIHQLVDKEMLINQLGEKIQNKDNECKKLQENIEKLTHNDANLLEIKNKLKIIQDEKNSLTIIYDKLLSDYSIIEKKYAELRNRENKLKLKIESRNKMIEEYKSKILYIEKAANEITMIIDECNNNLEQKESQINLISAIIEKSEKISNNDKKTLRKLYNNINSLKADKEKTQTEKEELKEKLDNIIAEKEKIEQEIKVYKENNIQLEEKIKEKHSEILYNKEIYDKIYTMIINSEKCIYIASPFVKEAQANNMKIKLLEALKKNPYLNIKVLYGIKDKNDNGKYIDEAQLKRSKQNIKDMKKALGNKLTYKETNTHVKIIIFDDKSFILGSANVLSFTGIYDKKPDLHGEVAILSTDRELLEKLKEKYFNW